MVLSTRGGSGGHRGGAAGGKGDQMINPALGIAGVGMKAGLGVHRCGIMAESRYSTFAWVKGGTTVGSRRFL